MLLQLLVTTEHFPGVLEAEVDDQAAASQLHVIQVPDCEKSGLIGGELDEGKTGSLFETGSKVAFKVGVGGVHLHCFLGVAQYLGLDNQALCTQLHI